MSAVMMLSSPPTPLALRSSFSDDSSLATIEKPHDALHRTFEPTVSPVSQVRALLAPYGPLPSRPQQTTCKTADADYTVDVVNAIRANDLATLRRLPNTVNMNASNNNGESLLHLACRRSNLDTIRFLVLEAKVNLLAQDSLGRTALHDVCWRPTLQVEILDLFLSQCDDPTVLIAPDVRGHTPLDYVRTTEWPQWNAYLASRQSALLQKM